jgi:uncharacterized protein (DUF2062 family)
MHARLIGRRLVPWPHRRIIDGRPARRDGWRLVFHPVKFISALLAENATPFGLAAAAAAGTLLAVLPLLGFHTLVILYVAARLHLNKVMAVAIQVPHSPPFVPFICIEVGYFLRHGEWWTDFTWQTIIGDIHHRLFDWLVGALVLAPVYASVAALAVYFTARRIQRRRGMADGG